MGLQDKGVKVGTGAGGGKRMERVAKTAQAAERGSLKAEQTNLDL